MAQAVPKLYDLSSTGHRTLGLTRRSRFQGPHAHKFDGRTSAVKMLGSGEKEDEDIDASPPKLGKGKELAIFEAEEYGNISDSSGSEVSKGKPGVSQQDTSLGSKLSLGGRHNDSSPSVGGGLPQSFPRHLERKRKAEHLGDDETTTNISFQLSQPGRSCRRAGYGKTMVRTMDDRNKTNPKEKDKRDPVKKRSSLVAKEWKSDFIKPPTENILAESQKRNESFESSDPSLKTPACSNESHFEEPIFKAPQIPSLRSEVYEAKSARKGHQKSPKFTRLCQAQQSLSELKPLSPPSSKLNVETFSNSALLAAQKLGLDDATFVIPASMPSTSTPSNNSCNSSGLPSSQTSDGDVSTMKVGHFQLEEDVPEIFSQVEGTSGSPQKTRCPLCKAPVDNIFMEGLTECRRLTIREQANFCEAHRHRTANNEWQARGYPTIDWSCLHMQVKIHSEAMDEILTGERPSYYRNAYDDFLKREKHRTLQQSLVQGGGIEEFSPGYYGSRGARIMIDNLMANYAVKLRRRSSTDNLISARGITNYVRAVLVPELATLLVMDDMDIDADKAREVLWESAELGNILNEEQDEVIKDPETDYIP